MDCIRKKNEAYFVCESGSRNHCGCESLVTLDCNTGELEGGWSFEGFI